MSGEAVVVTGAIAGGAAAAAVGLGLIVAASLAHQMAVAWQEQQRALAAQRMLQEKQRLAAWQSYQQAQQAEMQRLSGQRAALREALAGLRLQSAGAEAAGSPGGGGAASFAQASAAAQARRQREQIQAWLEALAQPLAQLPALQRLRGQAQRLDAAAPLETVQSLAQTLQRTAAELGAELEAQRRLREATMQQAEALLEQVLIYRALARPGIQMEEISALQAHLEKALEAGATLEALQILAKKFSQLQQEIDAAQEASAVQDTLLQRIAAHLQDLGYRKTRQAMAWEIPGGEQIRFALQANHQLAFQVAHEREYHSDMPLTADEIRFLRQQETLWCKDLQELARRLNADGFQYQVEFERQISENTVPTVMVESVDEVLEQTAEHGKAKRLLP